MKYIIKYCLVTLSIFIIGCGESNLDLTASEYEPKIVIDGYIYPDKKVKDIRITRNIPFIKDVDAESVILKDAEVKIIDKKDNKEFYLRYNPTKLNFEYLEDDLEITYGGTYRLEVRSVIDGSELFAASETTVPQKGFEILNKDLGSIKYRYKNLNNEYEKILIPIIPTAGASIFALSIIAMEPSIENFIFENAFAENLDSNFVKENFDMFVHLNSWVQGIQEGISSIDIPVEWYSLWFYSKYRIIVYAGDVNFHHYFITHQNVQEYDGNFHDPKFHIEGDGIGVFGSAIADTVYFNITR